MSKPAVKEAIGNMLLRRGIIDEKQLEGALAFQRDEGGKLHRALLKLEIVDEHLLVEFLCRELGLPFLDEIDVDLNAANLIPGEKALEYMAIPYREAEGRLYVAMADPSEVSSIDAIRFMTRRNVEVSVARESHIMESILAYYDVGPSDDPDIHIDPDDFPEEWEEPDTSEVDDEDTAKLADAPLVVKLVDDIMRKAIKKGASDIHIEPYKEFMRIRLRIDGILYEVAKPPIKLKRAIVNRIKIMAKLDIAERRLPQGGRIQRRFERRREMDFRVSIAPTLFGEKVVIRLLDKSNIQLDMTKLGFEEWALSNFKRAIHKPFGMVLVTGPTGSGKTTTLYSALSELNTSEVNISTAEDPIEFDLDGINQLQVHEEIGLTFANALREFLRQDPDIIMVGEIRDFETAEIAVKAALTGHLVLSTLHTNDASQTVGRLVDLGVEPFLLANSVNLILAQRLVRRICPECRAEIDPPMEDLRSLGVRKEEMGSFPIFEPKGCSSCNDIGFKGRVALYEVMPLSDELKELVLHGASALELKKEAIRLGMKSLRMAGVSKLKEGVTTISEVAGATVDDKG